MDDEKIIEIYNYLEISDEMKEPTLEKLFSVGFCPACGNQKSIKDEMEKSKDGLLPQYLFVFRDTELIGYMFLIAEKEKYSKAFPWWAVDNSDELPLNIAVQLLEYGIDLCLKCNCSILADRLKMQLDNQKLGIGRRPENLCR